MKVLVTIEATFEVEVDTHSKEHAVRAIEANWDSIYKHKAKWANGVPTLLQQNRVLRIEPQTGTPGTANILGVHDGGKDTR